MPKYEFQCNNCKETFEVTMSVKDKGITQIYCPSCKSQDLEQLYSGVNIHTGRTVKSNSGGCCGGQGCCK